jgi:hypothetical protein
VSKQSVTARQRERQQLLDRFGGDVVAVREWVIDKAMAGESISDVEVYLCDTGPQGDYDISITADHTDSPPTLLVSCELEDGVTFRAELSLTETGEVEQRSSVEVSWSGPLGRSRVLDRLGHPDFQQQLQDELGRPPILWFAGREWYRPVLNLGRGGRRLQDRDRALWAYRYTRALEVSPRSPNKVLAGWYEHLGYTSGHIRKIITEARDRGLLTAAPGRSQPGGELTARGLAFVRSFSPMELEVPTDGVD